MRLLRVFTPLIPAIFFFSAALYTAGVSLTDNKKMKYLYLLLALTSFAADAADPGSQYQQQAEAGDPRAQFYLADTWVSSGNYQQAEYWAQKAAAQGDGDAMALLAQLKIRNPQQADYQQARQLAEKSVQAGSKAGEIILAACWSISRLAQPIMRTPSGCCRMRPKMKRATPPSMRRCCWGLSTPAACCRRKMTSRPRSTSKAARRFHAPAMPNTGLG